MAKYTIQLGPEMEETLERLAPRGQTKAQVIRRALGLMKYLADEQAQGASIRVREKDGSEKEIVFAPEA